MRKKLNFNCQEEPKNMTVSVELYQWTLDNIKANNKIIFCWKRSDRHRLQVMLKDFFSTARNYKSF